MDQMALFTLQPTEMVRLRVAAATMEQHRRAQMLACRRERERRTVLQLDMWGEPAPVTFWVTKRRRRMGPAPKPRQMAVDVFSFAALGQRITVARGAQEREVRRIVTREDGVTRHVAVREQDTEEWAERERQRRARQRPPRPPKGAKTRSRKLQDLIGEDDGE